jgi:CDP-glucose 4,6-dehydratase
MADILTQSWAETHPFLLLHIARAGNVIGAFDVSQDRLLPDVIRALKQKTPLMVRHPEAVRPWQHVLDCLNGYLMFVDAIEDGQDLPVALNFGPDPDGMKSVTDVLRVASGMFPDLQIKTEASAKLKETGLLTLDSQMAYQKLGWENRLSFKEAIALSLGGTLDNPRESAFQAISIFLEQRAKSQGK